MLVLIIDDNKSTLIELSASLEKLGHSVMAASNCKQAIEIFQSKHSDLIILSFMMQDSLKCAKTLRLMSQDDWIPLLFSNKIIDDSVLAKGIEIDGDDYLLIPCDDQILRSKLQIIQRITDLRNQLANTKKQLSQSTSIDMLTGLNNRFQFDKVFNEKIAHVNRHQCIFALLIIDIDKFKIINEIYGHHIGDVLLSAVAKRLQSYLRLDDFIARISGDEFAIIISEIDNATSASNVAQRILDIMSDPFKIAAYKIYLSCSIGITYYPFNNTDANAVLTHAEFAMYHAKTLGFNTYQFFTPEILKTKNFRQKNH